MCSFYLGSIIRKTTSFVQNFWQQLSTYLLVCPLVAGCGQIADNSIKGFTTASISQTQFSLRDASVTDPITASMFAKSANVAVVIQAPPNSSVRKWCLSETQTTKPNSTLCSGGQGTDIGGWSATPPSNFTLSAGDGPKTIFLWGMNNGAEVFNSFKQASITYSTSPPNVTLSSLNGGQWIAGAKLASINWSTSGLVPSTINLDYSTDAGITWNSIAVGIQNLGFYSWSVPADNSSTYRIKVTATDLLGHSAFTSSSSNFNVKSAAPLLTQNLPAVAPYYSNSSNVTWGGTCEANDVIAISGTDTNSVTCSAGGNWSFTSANKNTDGQYNYNFLITDLAGNTTTLGPLSWIRDTSVPILTTNQMVINGNAVGVIPTTNNNYIKVSLKSSGSTSNITHFCLKTGDSTQPALNAACWIAVNAPSPGLSPAPTLTLVNFNYLLGFAAGMNTVYAWVKNQAGTISSLTSAGAGTDNQDRAKINYGAGTPPILVNVAATSTDTPSSPLSATDTNIPAGSNVYIKWNVTAANGFGANPITLYYTTDDTTYTVLANNISNSGNGGCTVDGSHSGCYLWTGGSPANSYYRIRVAATDLSSTIAVSTSNALNSSPINFLAGNTDPGLGGSASAAVFFNDESSADDADPQSFVVTPNGFVYFRDVNRGILVVDPSSGIQKLFIPTTGVSSGDGGPISGATLRYPLKIALDSSNRILVFDYDRIRRIDTTVNPMTINTIIGGGASTADGVPPLSVKIVSPGLYANYMTSASMPLVALPNGDIYFQSESYSGPISSGARVRLYKSSLNQVQSIVPSGTGAYNVPAQSVSSCRIQEFALSYDPTSSALTSSQMVCWPQVPSSPTPHTNLDPSTFVSTAPHPPDAPGGFNYAFDKVTGMDGEIYGITKIETRIAKYNRSTNTWVNIAGTGTKGTCSDGTPALSCNMLLYDVFVSALGQVYFIDRGRIRTIDSNGNVITLMGQTLSFGDGGAPLSARFDTVNSIDQKSDTGPIIILDQIEARFREFTIGGTINTIAGNGSNATPNTINPAVNQPILITSSGPFWDDFKVDANGNVYYNYWNGSHNGISKLDRTSGTWVQLMGAGATSYPSADGLNGNNIAGSMYPPRVLGFDGTNLLAVLLNYNGTSVSDAMLKSYNITSGIQSSVAGVVGAAGNSFCADGTALASCGIPNSYGINYSRASWDSFSNRWIMDKYSSNAVRTLTPGGTIATLTTLASAASSIAYKRNAGLTTNIIYYCSLSDQRLHKADLVAATDTSLAWPVATVQCTGRTLIYNSTRNSLIFPFKQSGLSGVAEYVNP